GRFPLQAASAAWLPPTSYRQTGSASGPASPRSPSGTATPPPGPSRPPASHPHPAASSPLPLYYAATAASTSRVLLAPSQVRDDSLNDWISLGEQATRPCVPRCKSDQSGR